MKKVNKGILTLLLAFIPLAIELLLILLTLYKNIGGVIWSTHFLIIILLFIIYYLKNLLFDLLLIVSLFLIISPDI